ncbi:MAG: prolipoprotein diacylglyceryl transferase [Clostridia bacterium]|nr:prolipoprotein diacylglyceryl transferase [Clostridia bacterium]
MATLTLGPLTVYDYGLAVTLSALVALLVAGTQMKHSGIKPGTLSWFALLAIPLGLLFARLGYCLIRYGWFFQQGIGWFFRLTDGGFVLYGTLLGCMIAALCTARITGQNAGTLMDTLAAPAALMIALCRLAEGLVGEGYGWDVEEWFTEGSGMSLFCLEDAGMFCFFPLAHYNESYYSWYWAVNVAEAAIALVIFVIILRSRCKRPGNKAATFLLMYAAMQALGESMRQDSVLRWGFVRVSQVLSAVAVAAVLLYWCIIARPGSTKAMVRSWVLTLMCMLIVIAMEFGVEKKIVFLEWLPVSCCYLIMWLDCIGMIFSVLAMRKSTEE